jgi:hypothetical protein
MVRAGATIVDHYRYRLWREWNLDGPRVTFIMLNPSVADHQVDDPTLRRCIGFAQWWSFGSLEVVNLFAYRSSSPQALRTVADPIGPENDRYLLQAAAQSNCIVAAWGCHGRYLKRDDTVIKLLAAYSLSCLDLNRDGSPKHPLYIKKGIVLRRFLSRADGGET